MRLFLTLICTATMLVTATSSASAQALHDSVPYQGDTLLVNPLPMTVHDADQAYLDCDWNTLMSMIRDLEERIAGALEVDTVYDVYVSGQVIGQRIYMNYDCVVLRDSVLSLQIQLDEALLGPPTVLSQEVMSIAQRTASIKAKVTDDGGAAMRIWGVIYGKQDWWNDSLGFFEVDSLFPNDVDFATISDSLLADRLTAHQSAMDSWAGPPAAEPIHTAMDTSILNVDSVFTRALTGLERYTNYIAIPVAANDSLMMDFSTSDGQITVNGDELDAWYLGLYGMGDTLMFQTLADTASGFTLDTASVTSTSARLITSITDAGGQGPDAVQFQYDTQDFTAATFAGDSISSDSTGGTSHSAVATGLTRYTDYYFRAFADNVQGRGNSESSMTFKTLPELPTWDTLYYDAGQDSLVSVLSDNGGQSPTAQAMAYANNTAFTSQTDLTASHRNDTIVAYLQESSLLSGEQYFVRASATNNAGVSITDTILIETRPEVTTLSANLGDSIQDIRTGIRFEGSSFYRSALPSAYGFIYGDSTLTNAADTAATANADSTFATQVTNLNSGTKYWYAAYATTLGGTAYGDTLYAGATAIGTTTDTAEVVSNESVILMATGDYSDALPDSVGFIWSTNADFSDADTVSAYLPSAGIYTWKDTLTGLSGGDEIFYTSFAQNERGMTSGDTLSSVTKAKVETLPLLASSDTSATFGGKLLEFVELAGHPDSVGFEWSTTDADMTDSSDSLFVFDAGTLAADSTYTLELPFEYGTLVWYRFFAINEGGTQHGQTVAFCAGACPETIDYLGETYPIVRLGCDCYFAENLRAVQYVSGDSITQIPVHTSAERSVFEAYETAIAVLDTTVDRSVYGVYYNGRMIYQSVHFPSLALCPPGWSSVDIDGLRTNVEPLIVFDEDDQYPGITGEGDSITSKEAGNAVFRRMKSTPLDDPAWDGSNLYGLSVFPTGFYDSEGDFRYPTTRAVFGGYGPIGGGYVQPWKLEIYEKPNNPVTATSTLNENYSISGISDGETNAYPVRCQILGIETPPTAVTQNATETTANSVRLNAVVAHPGWKTTSQLATVSDRGFVIASNPEMTDSTMVSVGIGGSDTIYLDLGGLVENQEYWFQPYATNQFSNMDSSATVGYGEVYSFIAMVPAIPTVETMPLSYLRQQRWGKTNNTWSGKLISKNNSEVESVTWSWYRASSPSDVKDSIEIAPVHSEVEDLVLEVDSIYYLSDWAHQDTIFHKDLQPGAEYHYFASVTNGIGTGYGDTLSIFAPMLIQPWSTTTTDSSVTIDGKVYWNEGDINEMAIVLQTEYDDDEVEKFTSRDDDDKYVFLDQWVLTSAFDTVPITPNPDSTFSVTIDLDQSNIGDFINYQIFATNTHAEADSTLTDTSYSQIQYFTMGACPTIDYEGYTYETQRINGKCWFTSNLRVVTYTNGDSIQFGGTQAGLTPGILDTLQANPVEGLGAYFFPDSAYLNDYGLLYSRSVMAQQADINSSRNVCPVGTHFVTYDEMDNLENEGNMTYRYEDDYRRNGYDSDDYIGRHYTDERYGGTNTSGLTINGGRFRNGSWYTDTTNYAILKSEVAVPYNGNFDSYDDDDYVRISGFADDRYDFEDPNATSEFKAAYPMRCIVDEPAAGPDVVTESPTDVTATGATLNASFDFEGWRGASETGFTWGYAADLSDGVNVVGDTLSGPFSATLTGLAADSTIYFRAFAKDAIGNESTGDIESACLLDCPTVTFDGHEYQTVAIGCQCWFAENLRTTVYADGSAIPEVTDNGAWGATTDGARCSNDNDSDNEEAYGLLYNWYAVDSAAGLCPTNWHVPTDDEFTTLADFLGGAAIAGLELKSSAEDQPSWDGTNSSGWSGLPGGARTNDGSFSSPGQFGFWWSSTQNVDVNTLAHNQVLINSNDMFTSPTNNVSRGFSVRCLRDASTAPVVSTAEASSVTDTTATLNGSVAFNWSATNSTGFKWGFQADLSDASDVAGDTLAGDFSADLTGLTSGDTVYFSAYATNALGTTYGDTLSFKTSACVPVAFDGYTYDVVKISNQCWFAENLRTTVYADGSAIPEVTDNATWGSLTTGARSAYNNEPDSAAIYGQLYNWYAVDSAAGLCPTGWHVPTDAEMTDLENFLGGESVAGDELKASAPAWDGTDSSGWSGLPGGSRLQGGSFGYVTNFGTWWSSSPAVTGAWFQILLRGESYVDRNDYDFRNGFSVRCLQD